jgi:hypothetical protein
LEQEIGVAEIGRLRALTLKPLPNQPEHDPEQGKACGKAERKVN